MSHMTIKMAWWHFYWSPEGRRLTSIAAANLREAKARFRKDFPQYARYMGEVYWQETPTEAPPIP